MNTNLRELQDQTVELVLERRRLESVMDEIDAEEQQRQHNAVNEEYQRQRTFDAEMQEQDAVYDEAEALGQDGESQRYDLGRWQEAVNEECWQDAGNMEALRQQEEI